MHIPASKFTNSPFMRPYRTILAIKILTLLLQTMISGCQAGETENAFLTAQPQPGYLAREILEIMKPRVAAFEKELPPGYHIDNGGIDEVAIPG